MSSPTLHIKDSYFFEVPKAIWRSNRTERLGENGFPEFWVAADEDYLLWEAERFLEGAADAGITLPDALNKESYQHWLHADHARVGKPFYAYVTSSDWYQDRLQEFDSEEAETSWTAKIEGIQEEAHDVREYDEEVSPWSEAKIEGYNHALDGKILIPQPFGELRNLHEPSSGFCISKFMIVQLAVALILGLIFIRLAHRLTKSDRPRGRIANLFESMLAFIRNDIARSAIGEKDGDKFVPLLWSIFFFVLFMNLMGMVPWVGAPTSAFSVTLAMAAITLLSGMVMGSIKFGPVGYWANQVPSMDLNPIIAIFIKPMLWVIEVAGLFIKHAVLAIRLLANMIAGHIILLGIMGIAFSVEGAMGDYWWVAAPISVVSSALFSLLELFVAFLQAYIFTFLSALFIGAAVHHH